MSQYLVGAAWPGAAWSCALRIEIAWDDNGRPYIIVGVEVTRVPHALAVSANPKIGIGMKKNAIWFCALTSGARVMTPVSFVLADTQWSQAAPALLAHPDAGLVLVKTVRGSIISNASLPSHPDWWVGLRALIALLPPCTIEQFVADTTSDGHLMGFLGSMGTIIHFAEDNSLDLI